MFSIHLVTLGFHLERVVRWSSLSLANGYFMRPEGGRSCTV